MSNILSFTPASATLRGARPRPQGPAAIVFFPGVRYERVAEPPPAGGAPRGRRAAARKGTAEPG